MVQSEATRKLMRSVKPFVSFETL